MDVECHNQEVVSLGVNRPFVWLAVNGELCPETVVISETPMLSLRAYSTISDGARTTDMVATAIPVPIWSCMSIQAAVRIRLSRLDVHWQGFEPLRSRADSDLTLYPHCGGKSRPTSARVFGLGDLADFRPPVSPSPGSSTSYARSTRGLKFQPQGARLPTRLDGSVLPK